MILEIHGWHKLTGWFAYLKYGTPWKLAEEVAEMRFPLPMIFALAATVVQVVCSLFLTVGLFTRINAGVLSTVLGVAIIQNVLADQDPQLAILYTLVTVTFTFIGGGVISLDRLLFCLSCTKGIARQNREQ